MVNTCSWQGNNATPFFRPSRGSAECHRKHSVQPTDILKFFWKISHVLKLLINIENRVPWRTTGFINCILYSYITTRMLDVLNYTCCCLIVASRIIGRARSTCFAQILVINILLRRGWLTSNVAERLKINGRKGCCSTPRQIFIPVRWRTLTTRGRSVEHGNQRAGTMPSVDLERLNKYHL